MEFGRTGVSVSMGRFFREFFCIFLVVSRGNWESWHVCIWLNFLIFGLPPYQTLKIFAFLNISPAAAFVLKE